MAFPEAERLVESPIQMNWSGPASIFGFGFTKTVISVVSSHVFTSLTNTWQIVVVSGQTNGLLTDGSFIESGEIQLNVIPPKASIWTVSPWHIVWSPPFVRVGSGLTSINNVSVVVHPFAKEPVKMYCCEAVGEAVGLGIVGSLKKVFGLQR